MGGKKTLIILLIVLVAIVTASGVYFFRLFKPAQQQTIDLQANLGYEEIFKVKETAIENILNFLKTKKIPVNLFSSFYDSPQYKALQELPVNIDLNEGIGNPKPFTPSSKKQD